MAKANQQGVAKVAAQSVTEQDKDQGTQAGGEGTVSAPEVAVDQGAEDAKAPVADSKTVKVRVLVQCEHGAVNDVVALPVDVAAAAERANQVDTDPAAVAYAESL